jgi:hypothetical protein
MLRHVAKLYMYFQRSPFVVGSSTQHECDMERIMADGRIGEIFELLRLLGKPTTNTPLGEILRRSVLAEPLINEVDSMLVRLERIWLEQNIRRQFRWQSGSPDCFLDHSR